MLEKYPHLKEEMEVSQNLPKGFVKPEELRSGAMKALIINNLKEKHGDLLEEIREEVEPIAYGTDLETIKEVNLVLLKSHCEFTGHGVDFGTAAEILKNRKKLKKQSKKLKQKLSEQKTKIRESARMGEYDESLIDKLWVIMEEFGYVCEQIEENESRI